MTSRHVTCRHVTSRHATSCHVTSRHNYFRLPLVPPTCSRRSSTCGPSGRWWRCPGCPRWPGWPCLRRGRGQRDQQGQGSDGAPESSCSALLSDLCFLLSAPCSMLSALYSLPSAPWGADRSPGCRGSKATVRFGAKHPILDTRISVLLLLRNAQATPP